MIFRLTNRARQRLVSGPSFRAALLCVLAAGLLSACGPGGGAPAAEDTAPPTPPEAFPGVIDLPRATEAGFFRCGTETGGAPRDSASAPASAPLSDEFILEYLASPPWQPEPPAFLPVDPREHERWMRQQELRQLFLFRHDPASGAWRPDAAASASLDPETRTLTVRLREDLGWSDGSEVTAADWVRSVEEIYQQPAVQSPLKAVTEAGGALWRTADPLTLTVTFASIPADPLALLAIPALPLSDSRALSLAQGNLDALYELELAKEELPVIPRPGAPATRIGTTNGPGSPFSSPEEGQGILVTTGASERVLLLLYPRDSQVAACLPELLPPLFAAAFAEEEAAAESDLFLLPAASPGVVPTPTPPPGPRPGAEASSSAGCAEGLLPGLRLAYAFGSPAARAAAALLAAQLEAEGVRGVEVAPENPSVLSRDLELFLRGRRELSGELVLMEARLPAGYPLPEALLGGVDTSACLSDSVDSLSEWYTCVEEPARRQLLAHGPGGDNPAGMVVLGRVPRLAFLEPSACFGTPVPSAARAIDLLEVWETSEKE